MAASRRVSSTDKRRDAGIPGSPRSHRGCWPARPDLGERWPSRLVATAEEDRVSFRRNLRRFVTASDCQTIAIYDLAGFSVSWAGLGRVLVNHICKAKLTKYCCNI